MNPQITPLNQSLHASGALIAKRQKCEKLVDWVDENPTQQNQWIFWCVCNELEKVGKSYPNAEANADDRRTRNNAWNQIFQDFEAFKNGETDLSSLTENFSSEEFLTAINKSSEKSGTSSASKEIELVPEEKYSKNELHDLTSLEKEQAALIQKKIDLELKVKETDAENDRVNSSIRKLKLNIQDKVKIDTESSGYGKEKRKLEEENGDLHGRLCETDGKPMRLEADKEDENAMKNVDIKILTSEDDQILKEKLLEAKMEFLEDKVNSLNEKMISNDQYWKDENANLVKSFEEERVGLQQTITEANNRNSSLDKQVKQLNDELELSNMRFESEKEDLTIKNHRLDVEVRAGLAENAKHQEKINEMSKNVENLNETLQTLTNEKSSVQNKYDSLSQFMKSANAEIVSLQEQNSILKSDIEKTAQMLTESNTNLEQATAQKADISDKLTQIKETLGAKELEVQDILSKKANLEEKIIETDKKLVELQADSKTRENQFSVILQQLDSEKSSHIETVQQKTNLEAQLSEISGLHKTVSNQLENAMLFKESNKKMASCIEGLRDEIGQHLNTITTLKDSVLNLEAKVKSFEEEKIGLQQIITETKNQNSSLEKQVKQLTDKIEVSNTRFESETEDLTNEVVIDLNSDIKIKPGDKIDDEDRKDKAERGKQELFKSVRAGNLTSVLKLLKNLMPEIQDCVDDNLRYNKFTALHLSAYTGSLNVTELLVENFKFDQEKLNGWRQTPFLSACAGGQKDQMEYFIERNPAVLKSVDKYNRNALHLSARFGKLNGSILLVEKYGFDFLDCCNDLGRNAFLEAACGGKKDQMKYFIEKNPEVLKSVDAHKMNALHLSSKFGTLIGSKVLAENYCFDIFDCSNDFGRNVFLIAAVGGKKDQMQYFIDMNQEVLKSVDAKKNNALHLSSRFGTLNGSKLLVEKYDFDIFDCSNDFGRNAFHYATVGGKKDQIGYFLKRDPKIKDSTNSDGWNALHFSVAFGTFEFTKFLIEELNFQASVETKSGEDLFLIAKKYDNKDDAKLISYIEA